MFGVVAVTNKFSQIYFILFYLVTVVVVLNLIVAFIVDAFVSKFAASDRSDGWGEGVKVLFREAQVHRKRG